MGKGLARGKNGVLSCFFLKLEPHAHLKATLWAAIRLLSRVEVPFT